MSDKKKVEAVLFSLGKEVSLERLSELCGLEKKKVTEVMSELEEEYAQRDHSLKIIRRGDLFKLTVKDEFIPLVSKLVEEMDMDRALMETLAVIAWKYPVVQSEVIKLRHNKAYEHIKRLIELEFVEKERFGRTYKLKLTKKFFEYFDLPSEEAKDAFLKTIPEKVIRKAEEVDQEADEVGRLVEQEKKETKAKEEIRGAIGEVVGAVEKKPESEEKVGGSVDQEDSVESQEEGADEISGGEEVSASDDDGEVENENLVEVDAEMAEQMGVEEMGEEAVPGEMGGEEEVAEELGNVGVSEEVEGLEGEDEEESGESSGDDKKKKKKPEVSMVFG